VTEPYTLPLIYCQAKRVIGSVSALLIYINRDKSASPNVAFAHWSTLVCSPSQSPSTLPSVYWLMPSSSHASSNSLVATMPYQYWWPNSCSVTDSTA
jgi:hypothetical protein